MTDRDKLNQIVSATIGVGNRTDKIVDDLLANGVIVPPCYIGQAVWHLSKHFDGSVEIVKGKISMLQQKADKSWKFRFSHNSSVWDFKIDDIGIRYFLTKEEAKKKLKELKDNAQ